MSILFSNIQVAPSTDVGTGGIPFECQAPHPGLALVGLNLRVGHWIDQVSPVFAEVLDDGTLGRELVGPTFGGMGGTPQRLRVSPGHVVTGLQTRSGNFIDGVRLFETRWEGLTLGRSNWTPWMTGYTSGGIERPERLVQSSNAQLVVGIAGRAGQYLDNLTIIMAEIQRIPTAQIAHSARSSSKNATPQVV